jgi:DNA-binding NarL/FixJ family response regulator
VKFSAHPVIFIVDRSQSYRIIIKNILQLLNYRNLHTFQYSEECYTSAIIPDIIILDHNLGNDKQSGLDFLRRNRSRYPNTCFFFFSSSTNPDIALDSIRWGAIEYILKSKIGLTILIEKLENFVLTRNKEFRNELYLKSGLLSLGLLSVLFVLGIILYKHQII